VEESEQFLTDLVSSSKTPPATVLTISARDVSVLKLNAAERGLQMQVLEALPSGEETVIVIGRDERAVTKLYEVVNRRSVSRSSGRDGLSWIAAMAVGAIGTVAALALS
jgi:hypothetical protein